MLTQAQKSEALAKVYHFVKVGNETFNTDLPIPVVLFKKRGTCGGTAYYNPNENCAHELDFNPGLMVDNWDEYMNQVIPHEVAHLLDKHMYGDQYKFSRRGKRTRISHGPTWKKVMRGLGVEPDRCHKMDTSKTKQVKRPQTKYIYACTCCGEELVVGPKHHKKLISGYSGLSHKGCRGASLDYVKTVGRVTRREASAHTRPAAERAANAATKPAKKAAKKAAPKAGTKIAKALKIYKASTKAKPGITRQEMITIIAGMMEIEPKAAAGYYQTCKKKAA